MFVLTGERWKSKRGEPQVHPRQKLPQNLCLSRVVFIFFPPFGIVCYQPQVVDVNRRERVQKKKRKKKKKEGGRGVGGVFQA